MQVSTFCLGTMVLGAWGNRDEDECQAIIQTALDAGVNFIDTADMYAFGESEEIVGRALRGRRDSVILATKFFNAMGEDPNHRGASRRWIVRAVEDSLRRLGRTGSTCTRSTDRTPPRIWTRRSARCRISCTPGRSEPSGRRRSRPSSWSRRNGWPTGGHVRPSTEQPPYSIFARGIERAVLPTCQRYGLGVLVWAPLNGGWLTGKYRSGEAPAASRAEREPDHFDFGGTVHDRKMALVEDLVRVADDAGVHLVDLAHALGARSPGRDLRHPRSADAGPAQGVLTGAGTRIPDDVWDRVGALVPPGLT